MAVISMRQMLEAGVHFGHQTRRWNPKMRRFIFGERNGIYIIDLEQTLTRVETAYGYVRDLVAGGGTILFVGTKKQAQDPIASFAQKVGMPYVNERWLGGMLTNFETISKRVNKMLDYERMKASGEFDAMIKKEALLLDRELTKLQRNLGGLRDMKATPDAVFVVDTKKEHIAVTEANKLGIPVVAVVDTNVDPDVIQFPIPGNDDAIRANSLLIETIATAVEEGRYIASRRPKTAADDDVPAKPERSPEEEAAFAQAQAEARNAAARAQQEREARLAASKSRPEASPTDEPADAPGVEAAVEQTGQQASAAEPATAAVDSEPEQPEQQASVTEQPDGTAAEAAPQPATDVRTDPVAAGAEGESTPDAPYGTGSHAASPDDSMPEGFPIKGNADSMLYHTEDSPFYGRTKAEVWFASEAAAEAAGFSKPAVQQD